MDPLLTAVIITWAIKHFWEKGSKEYAHTRDTHAAELARSHPDWSERKIQRHARRRARGYWWDQIRRGFPDLKAAYDEDRLVAEHARVKADLDGVKRRKELRDRIAEAMGERQRILDEIREQEKTRRAPKADPPEPAPTDTPNEGTSKADTPAAPKPEPQPGTKPQPGPEEAAPEESTPASAEPGPDDTVPDPAPAAPVPPQPTVTQWISPCENCGKPIPVGPMVGRDGKPVLCGSCTPTSPGPVPPAAPSDAPPAGSGATVTPIRPQVIQGEVMQESHGYEQTLAVYTDEVDAATRDLERAGNEIADRESRDAGYEAEINRLRALKADDDTIGRIVALREANEQRLEAARQTYAASENHHAAAASTLEDWTSRHGAVDETKKATQTSGDEALYTG